ncbi:MAG: LacI family DNA-binding transcriptional regulator [Velocimicrobium sp.]
MKVSIRQISEKTGFSPATISNALNRKKGVNKETAAEIFRVAKELGYIDEERITKIKFVMYRKNGSIIEDTPFFSLLIDGFEKECGASGYEVVICNLDSRSLDYEEQVKWLINDTSSAVVLLGTELMDEDLELFKGAKCPFLLFDYWSSDMEFNAVLINNADSARMATEYLIGKGHRKIGYLRGKYRIKSFRSRHVGYTVALNKAGIKVNSAYTITIGTSMNEAYTDMVRILQKKPEMPTAFFADNDMVALGAMKALTEFGYKIPEDISIIGFDDLPFCEIATPRLTTLRVAKQEMGQAGAKRIIELIKKPSAVNLKIQVCTSFVERDSVKELVIK